MLPTVFSNFENCKLVLKFALIPSTMDVNLSWTNQKKDFILFFLNFFDKPFAKKSISTIIFYGYVFVPI